MLKYLIVFFTLVAVSLFAQVDQGKIVKKVQSLEKPLYNPFVENYILNELKQLREENRALKVQIHKTLAKKEVEISNNAINYATSTINNMFYIIAAATSLLVIVGWSSIRDIKNNIQNLVDEKVSKLIQEYETRMNIVESDLAKRTKQVIQNQKDIEETNTIHSLWMRASSETTLSGKIDVYDEVLTIRPDDVEAIVYKADAVLDLGEAHWALNLTNQALEIDNKYADALYQRGKVYSVLGLKENALDDLLKAIEYNEQYIFELKNEKKFSNLLDDEKIVALLEKYQDHTSI